MNRNSVALLVGLLLIGVVQASNNNGDTTTTNVNDSMNKCEVHRAEMLRKATDYTDNKQAAYLQAAQAYALLSEAGEVCQ